MNDKKLTQLHNSRVYDNFLMHWKYIKREKVNGKWKYTYELPGNTNSTKADKVSAATKAVGAGSKYIDDAYQKEVEYNSKKNDFGDFKPLTGESLSSKIDYDKKKDEVNKTVEKQNKNATQVTTKKNVSSEYEKELEYNSKKNVYPEKTIDEQTIPEKVIEEKVIKEDIIPDKVIKDTIIENQYIDANGNPVDKNGNPIKSTTKSVKNEKFTDKIKRGAEEIADKLGFDEREDYKKAKTKYENAKDKYDDADLIADEETRKFRESTVKTWTKDDSERLQRALSSASFWRDTVEKRGKEYASAKAEYYKTPIGKISKFANAGREWFKDLFD